MTINKLTLKEVKSYRKETLVAMLYQNQDLACNIDYIKNPIESDIVQSNINLIESVLIFKEY
jgi:hypothetical protein